MPKEKSWACMLDEATRIAFNEFHGVAVIRTTSPSLIEKLDALCEEYPTTARKFVFKQRTDGDVFIDVVKYCIPKEFIAVRTSAKRNQCEAPGFSEYIRGMEREAKESVAQYNEEMRSREERYKKTIIDALIANEMRKAREEAVKRIMAERPDLFAEGVAV